MTDEEKTQYKKQIAEIIDACLDGDGSHHGLLIVANSIGVLSLYSINIAEQDLPMLLDAASHVVCSQPQGVPS